MTGIVGPLAVASPSTTGATAPGGYRGVTVSGPPATGAWLVGEWVTDQAGKRWTCTVAGTFGGSAPTFVQEPGTFAGVPDGSVTGGTAGAGVKIAAGTITDANLANANKAAAFDAAGMATAEQARAVAAEAAEAAARASADTTNTTAITTEVTTARAAEATKAQNLTRAAIRTANFTAVVGTLYPLDTTAGAIAGQLPTAPANGSRISVVIALPSPLVNTASVVCGGSDHFHTATGLTTLPLVTLRQKVTLQYDLSTAIWSVDNSLDLGSIDARYPVLAQSVTAPVLATSGTIATANLGLSRVAPAGPVTGVVLAAGTFAGQRVTVHNESAAANSIAFATDATSNVANAAGVVIPGLGAAAFSWDSVTTRWATSPIGTSVPLGGPFAPSTTGATGPTRYVGGLSTVGPPTSGTFAAGDWIRDGLGDDYTCLVAGTPGVWISRIPVDNQGIYGDGSDGDVTVSGAMNLIRDMYYDNLTVSGQIVANGFRVFCRTSLTLTPTGFILCDGGIGNANGTAGLAMGNQSLYGGLVGGTGTVGAGTTSPPANNSMGGRGGAGGLGSAGAGGGGGVNNSPPQTSPRSVGWALRGQVEYQASGVITVSPISGGTGGGGGGGDGTVKGGGGGGGGGVIVLAARLITNAGLIRATGGAGGSPASGNAGGGGGGGGGCIFMVYDRLAPGIGTVQAPGGPGGVHFGTGVDGVKGADGNVIRFRNRTPYLRVGELDIPSTRVGLTPLTTEPNYRAFGTLAKMANGTIRAVWRAGNQHAPDTHDTAPLAAMSDIGVIQYSDTTDNGLTWTTAATLYTYPDVNQNIQTTQIMVTAAGTVLLFFDLTWADHSVHTPVSEPNQDYVMRSTDNGATFGSPILIPDAFDFYAEQSNPPVQLSAGNTNANRLLMSSYGVTNGRYAGASFVTICKSDNDGVTWAKLAEVPMMAGGNQNLGEPSLVYISDSLVVCFIRQIDTGGVARSVSTDGGATWSVPLNVIREYPTGYAVGSSPSAIYSPTRQTILLLGRAQIVNTVGKRHAVWTSLDNGVTWAPPVQLDEGKQLQPVYGGLYEYSPGKLLCVYFNEENVAYLDASAYSKRLVLGPA